MAKAISVYIQSTYCERLIQVEIDEEKHAGQIKNTIKKNKRERTLLPATSEKESSFVAYSMHLGVSLSL